MNNKRIGVINSNFILIIITVLLMISSPISNMKKYNNGEIFLNKIGDKISSEQIKIEDEKISLFIEKASEIGIAFGNVSLDIMWVLFIWIPLIHAASLFLLAWIAWLIYRPVKGKILMYRILMTLAYINILVSILVLVIGIMIHYSTFQKIKMGIFVIIYTSILIYNFYITYSGRVKGEVKEEIVQKYDIANQIPVIRSSICTGEKVAGFKDIHTGKFEEVMLIKDDKDMNQFMTDYGVNPDDVKKEW